MIQVTILTTVASGETEPVEVKEVLTMENRTIIRDARLKGVTLKKLERVKGYSAGVTIEFPKLGIDVWHNGKRSGSVASILGPEYEETISSGKQFKYNWNLPVYISEGKEENYSVMHYDESVKGNWVEVASFTVENAFAQG